LGWLDAELYLYLCPAHVELAEQPAPSFPSGEDAAPGTPTRRGRATSERSELVAVVAADPGLLPSAAPWWRGERG